MTAISISRIVLPLVAVVAAGGVVFAVQYVRHEPPADTMVATAAPTISQPTPDTREQSAASLANAKSQANAVVDALIGPPPSPERSDGVPTFDVARIEPSGEAVIAGRAAPGATVELLRDGEVHDRAVADKSGQFVIIPPRLPPGTYDLTLRAKQADGQQTTSKQRVTTALEPQSTDRPIVALVTPDKPTVVLSQPAAPKPVAGAVVVETVEVERGGKFHVSGQARPGASLRLYLNDSFVTSVTSGADGRFAVTINEGVAPGNYRVRLDETSSSGTVRARAEVPFNAPDTTASVSAQAAASKRPDSAAPQQPQLAAAGTTVLPDNGSPPSAVVVPKITTTTVSPGDSLWRLSQQSYGAGTRYAVIYKANKGQIRNPNLIYPGQVFVLPAQ
ncbi:LysM peptidoglycan-binding domain-containing protein [Bradyrhizobium sp. WSM 1738]|uniref:LysM peptidoglycan-binding domain-containing protein n=1 Tax=Bradyrhizobium hereditatis TaxID=2821405 RepID=UPI001CE31341|nr:LysM peptidoglycan-binding domain-containing protein [Bradyrhizobium hereditatis]MCA6119237.1 LysM peptidoglycan-binding domain-containing protein [Bradyrhizobium hereditatis]